MDSINTTILEQFRINSLCEIHKKLGLTFASLASKDPNPFQCSTCAKKKNKSMTDFISIEDILATELTLPIQSWPPGISDDSIKFLNNKDTTQIVDKLRDGINSFYSNLWSRINAVIEQSKKDQLAQLDLIKVGAEEVIQQYNDLFKRNELIDIFQKFNSESQENYIKLLDSMSESSEKNLSLFTSAIKEKTDAEMKFRQFQETTINELQKKFLSIINELSLSLFSNTGDEDIIDQYNQRGFESKLSLQLPLQKKILFLSMNNVLDVSYLSSFKTTLKNTKFQDSIIIGEYYINKNAITSFNLKFKDANQLSGFRLGIGFYNRLVYPHEKSEQFFIEFWNKLSQQILLRQPKNSELNLQFSLDFSKQSMKAESDYISLKDTISDKIKQNLNCYFVVRLLPLCDGVEISEYNEITQNQ